MPYSRLLKQVIADSGYTNKELLQKCTEEGVKIDKAYLSKLSNGKVPPPSEEVSRAIARICGVDESLLVIEGYVDKAPEEVRNFFEIIKFTALTATTKLLQNNIPEQVFKELRNYISKEPIANFILQITQNDISSMQFDFADTEVFKLQDNDMKITLNEPVSILIKDNSMFPALEQNSKVTLRLKEIYNDGDLLLIKVKDEENLIARYVFFVNDKVVLKAINKDYPTLEYELDEVTIMGEVAQIIVDK